MATEADLEDLLASMEKAVARLETAHGSLVRLQGAEVDTLGCVERCRNLMLAVVQDSGDRERAKLLSLLGGDGQRMPRIRGLLLAMRFQDEHSPDKRLAEALGACDMVEGVLRDKDYLKEPEAQPRRSFARRPPEGVEVVEDELEPPAGGAGAADPAEVPLEALAEATPEFAAAPPEPAAHAPALAASASPLRPPPPPPISYRTLELAEPVPNMRGRAQRDMEEGAPMPASSPMRALALRAKPAEPSVGGQAASQLIAVREPEPKRSIDVMIQASLEPAVSFGPDDTVVMELSGISVNIATRVWPALPSSAKAFRPSQELALVVPELKRVVFDPRSQTPPGARVGAAASLRALVVEVPPGVPVGVQCRCESPWGSRQLREGGPWMELHYAANLTGRFTMACGDGGSTLVNIEVTCVAACFLNRIDRPSSPTRVQALQGPAW